MRLSLINFAAVLIFSQLTWLMPALPSEDSSQRMKGKRQASRVLENFLSGRLVAIQSNERYILNDKIINSPSLFNKDNCCDFENIVKSDDFYYDPLIIHQFNASEPEFSEQYATMNPKSTMKTIEKNYKPETKFLERFVVMNPRNSMTAIEENYITNKEFPFTKNLGLKKSQI